MRRSRQRTIVPGNGDDHLTEVVGADVAFRDCLLSVLTRESRGLTRRREIPSSLWSIYEQPCARLLRDAAPLTFSSNQLLDGIIRVSNFKSSHQGT